MKQWEIWTWDFGFGPHPAVIISHPDRVQHKPDVNILKCSSATPARPPERNEVVLDQADGLNWRTYCACDLIFGVDKSKLRHSRGLVSVERQRQIIRTVVASMGWQV